MLYSCTHMATVGFKGLMLSTDRPICHRQRLFDRRAYSTRARRDSFENIQLFLQRAKYRSYVRHRYRCIRRGKTLGLRGALRPLAGVRSIEMSLSF